MKLNPDACYRALAARDARFDGRLFVAVHTTGVYCRPICPTRTPKRENVTFYPTASAPPSAFHHTQLGDHGSRGLMRVRGSEHRYSKMATKE